MPAHNGPLQTWLDGLAHDAEVFPHQLDTVNRQLLLVRLSARQIQEAAFLDQRVLKGHEAGAWIPLDAVLDMPAPQTVPRGLILHCGHAGSTLISRLLGELPGVTALREPLLLQALAGETRTNGTALSRLRSGELGALLALSQRLLAKTPPDRPHALIKHTSLTANLAPRLLELPTAAPILCLWIPLDDYLATMLREASLRAAVRAAAGEWIHDLIPILGDKTPVLGECNDAQLAALNWCAAQYAFARARTAAPERVSSLCFSDFLDDPEARLSALAQHFGLACPPAAIEQALCTSWLRRYAKDPRYPFDGAERMRELAAAKSRLADELTVGIRFARQLWQRLPMGNAFTSPA